MYGSASNQGISYGSLPLKNRQLATSTANLAAMRNDLIQNEYMMQNNNMNNSNCMSKMYGSGMANNIPYMSCSHIPNHPMVIEIDLIYKINF